MRAPSSEKTDETTYHTRIDGGKAKGRCLDAVARVLAPVSILAEMVEANLGTLP